MQFDISITSRLVSHDYRLSRSTQQMELIFKRGILKFMFLFTTCKNQFESRDQVFLLMLRFFSVIIRYIFFSCFLFFLQLLWMKLYIIIKKKNWQQVTTTTKVFPLCMAYSSLYLHKNEYFHVMFRINNYLIQFLSADVLFWEIVNLDLTFSYVVCHKPAFKTCLNSTSLK